MNVTDCKFIKKQKAEKLTKMAATTKREYLKILNLMVKSIYNDLNGRMELMPIYGI